MNDIIDLIRNANSTDIAIGSGIVIGLLFLIILLITSKNKHKKNQKNQEKLDKTKQDSEINPTSNYNYNPLKNIKETQVNSNLNSNYNLDINISNEKKKKEKKKKEKKLTKKEKEFNSQKEICLTMYNNLYNVYYTEGYSVDLFQNDTLSYYTSIINNASNIDELKEIEVNLSYQTTRILDEIKTIKSREFSEKQRKSLYDECVYKISELDKLFKVLDLGGGNTIKEFNNRLLTNGMFAQIDDYQLIYNDLVQNIQYIKEKYKTNLNKSFGEETSIIDIKLIESLRFLGCKIDETNLKIIKTHYINLVKKYHPDNNQDSKASLDMTSKINEAYAYSKKILKDNSINL